VNRNILHFAENRYTSSEISSFEDDAAFSLPHYFTLGLAWKKNYNYYLDNEVIIGKYGGKKLKKMELWIFRFGVEKEIGRNYSIRFGMTNPLIAKTSTLGNLRSKLPNPKFTLTAGCGFKYKQINLDLAVFFNPGQSYVQQKPVPGLYLSGSYRY